MRFALLVAKLCNGAALETPQYTHAPPRGWVLHVHSLRTICSWSLIDAEVFSKGTTANLN